MGMAGPIFSSPGTTALRWPIATKVCPVDTPCAFCCAVWPAIQRRWGRESSWNSRTGRLRPARFMPAPVITANRPRIVSSATRIPIRQNAFGCDGRRELQRNMTIRRNQRPLSFPNLGHNPRRGSFHMRVNRVLILSLFYFATAMAKSEAQMNPGSPVVLGNEQIRVEAWIADERLHERYLARDEGQWIAIATAAEDGTAGPAAVIEADQSVAPGRVLKVVTDAAELVEEFAVGERQVIRKVRLCSQGPWIHVTTRLQPATPVKLHAFVDRFQFSHQPDWCFAPSVGGFIPDAQYKAPLILVQSGRKAFGIVPDVTELDRRTLQQCNHALDLDVPGGPRLAVGS